MDGTGPDGQVQWLLSQMVGTFLSADQSSDCEDFAQHLNTSRRIAEELRTALNTQVAPCPSGLRAFLDTVERTTADGHSPEDRELLGLMDWATDLYESCACAQMQVR